MSGRDLAFIVGGVAAGMVGSRLLPPLMAMGIGTLRGRASGDPFQKLENDHRVILATLRAMEEAETDRIAKRTTLFLAVKRKLAKHALAEEDVVYPLLNDEAERREGAKHLYQEHAEMKILLYEIESALMADQSWSEPIRKLREMVERHTREEEDVHFPYLRQVLSEREFGDVGAQVHREEALIL